MSKVEWSERCEDCSERGKFIYPWGTAGASVAIVGDQPAFDHKSTGSECAFAMDVDAAMKSKRVLIAVFSELDQQIDDFYWTNAHKCAMRLSSDQERSCEYMLAREISNYAYIIALGNTAANAVSTIQTDADVVQVWHPAYVLRRPDEFDEYVEQWREVIESGHRTLDQFK